MIKGDILGVIRIWTISGVYTFPLFERVLGLGEAISPSLSSNTSLSCFMVHFDDNDLDDDPPILPTHKVTFGSSPSSS